MKSFVLLLLAWVLTLLPSASCQESAGVETFGVDISVVAQSKAGDDKGTSVEEKKSGKGTSGKGGFDRRKKRKGKKGGKGKKSKKCDKPGKKHPKYHYVDCDTKSPAPTVTYEPTWSPTGTPVPTETGFPSISMTWTPTQTAVPTTSVATPAPTPVPTPDPTPVPTPGPTLSPTTSPSEGPTAPLPPSVLQKNDACAAAAAGEVFNTSSFVGVTYFYELLTFSNLTVAEAAAAAEEKIRAFLATQMVVCTTGVRRRLETLGVGPGAPDMEAPNGQCQNLDDSAADVVCYFMEGTVTLFLSADSNVTAISGANQVFDLLGTALNARRRLQAGFVDPQAGILGLFFRGGVLQGETPGPSDEVPSSAQDTTTVSSGRSLPAMGVVLIALACVGVLMVGLFAYKRKKQQRLIKDRGIMLEIDDDETLGSQKNTVSIDDRATETMSTPGQVAHILADEDDSLFTMEVETTYDKFLRKSANAPTPQFVPATEVYSPSVYPTRNYAVDDTVEL